MNKLCPIYKSVKQLLWINAFLWLFVSCNQTPPPTPETVIIKETVVAEKEVTRIVEIEVTKVVEREKEIIVTATPEPATPTPEPHILFRDDFTEASSDWAQSVDGDVDRFIDEGQYHILVKSANTLAWSGHPNLNVIDDFRLDVDVTQISDSTNSEVGILFRYENSDNWYSFLISSSGSYNIGGHRNDESFDVTKWVEIPAIQPGQATNHLQLIAKGPQITVFVNGELIASVPSNIYRRGDIKLVAGSFGEPDIHFAFDNLVVTAVK